MIIVSDSSPIISFAIIEKLDVLLKVFTDIFIPKAVYDEITTRNKPYSKILRDFVEDRVKYVNNRLAVEMLNADLDLGEAEVIVLALEQNVKNILIDDYKGRRIARSNDLFPIGTIGVLLQAKKEGFINSVKPLLDTLIRNKIRISKSLYSEALFLAREE